MGESDRSESAGVLANDRWRVADSKHRVFREAPRSEAERVKHAVFFYLRRVANIIAELGGRKIS